VLHLHLGSQYSSTVAGITCILKCFPNLLSFTVQSVRDLKPEHADQLRALLPHATNIQILDSHSHAIVSTKQPKRADSGFWYEED